MIYIREHLQNPLSGEPPRTALVHTVKEFLTIPWVARQAHPPFFLQFSVSAKGELIVEHEGPMGYRWAVVGTVEGEGLDALPAWQPDAD
jgi:hypothetical protein